MCKAMILLVEGARAGEESLSSALLSAGFEVVVFHKGSEALAWAENDRSPDLIVFNGASMPSNSAGTCRRLHEALADVPILHTRASGEKMDGSAGADVYLKKPYTGRKVLNRVYALLPADELEEEVVRAGTLTYFRGKRSVDIGGEREKQLTPKLALLLEMFLRHPNRILSRRRLMQDIWQTDYLGDTRTLDVHIHWVREAIEEDASQPRRLTTVRGVGYVFHLTE